MLKLLGEARAELESPRTSQERLAKLRAPAVGAPTAASRSQLVDQLFGRLRRQSLAEADKAA